MKLNEVLEGVVISDAALGLYDEKVSVVIYAPQVSRPP
jgi:hypothetical protein